MAIVNKGFPGTVNATEYAKSWYLGGAEGCDGTGWLTSQGTGRQTSTAAGDAFAAGVLSSNSAPILTSIPTPVSGQWFLIVRRIDWAGAGTVTVEAVAHTTTTTTLPTAPPVTYPTINTAPGSMYDHRLAWAWARNTDTTMVFFDIRKKPLESRLRTDEESIGTVLVATASLNGGSGRSTGANYPVATLGALDAVSNAVIGDIAQVALPGTGVDPIAFRAVAGSGAGIDWRIDSAIYADTKANLDTATTTLTGITDIIFRIGDLAYAADTGITYRWNSSVWQAWTSNWITWLAAPSNFTVGTGGAALSQQEYKYIAGRLLFRVHYILGTTGASVTGQPTLMLPMSLMLPVARTAELVSAGSIYDVSAITTFQARARINITTANQIAVSSYTGTYGGISATAPMTWAAGDELAVEFWADPA